MPRRPQPTRVLTDPVNYEVEELDEFSSWLKSLRNASARAIIARRIDRLRRGNLGNCSPVGGAVAELKVDFGPGYRVYFTERKGTLFILLCGGDKDSQPRDIRRAKRLAAELCP